MTGASAPRAQLAALQIADPPEAWRALGFTVSEDGVVVLGGVELWPDATGRGITGWTLGASRCTTMSTACPPASPPTRRRPRPDIPTAALGLDHVVVTTPDFDRTATALQEAGIPLRRVRPDDAGAGWGGPSRRRARGAPTRGRRCGRGFAGSDRPSWGSSRRRPCRPGPPGSGGSSWSSPIWPPCAPDWRRIVGEIRDAVQPGRRIAALDRAAGLSPRIAFMDPE